MPPGALDITINSIFSPLVRPQDVNQRAGSHCAQIPLLIEYSPHLAIGEPLIAFIRAGIGDMVAAPAAPARAIRIIEPEHAPMAARAAPPGAPAERRLRPHNVEH